MAFEFVKDVQKNEVKDFIRNIDCCLSLQQVKMADLNTKAYSVSAQKPILRQGPYGSDPDDYLYLIKIVVKLGNTASWV
jgi:hypothetical protein